MHMIFGKWYQQQAFNHFVRGNFDKAERWFQKLLSSKPGTVGVRHNLALVKLAMKRHDEAVQLLNDELDRFGGTYERYRGLADAYYLWSHAEEAAEAYRKALEMGVEGKDRVFLTTRIEICSDETMFASAMEGLKLFNDANDMQRSGHYEEALTLFRKSVDLDPSNFIAHNNLGSLHMNYEEDYPAAIAEFEAALALTELPLIQKNLQMCRDKRDKQAKERKHHAND